MKKILLPLVIVLMALGSTGIANAQEMVDDDRIMMESNDIIKRSLNKATVTAWYDFVGSASTFGVSWTRITNSTLFPDTLVYQLYGDGAGGVLLGKTAFHSVGQIFDPKDEFIFSADPKNISRFNPYLWDTVAFLYRYAHNIPGTVDTLLVQFYNNNKILKTTLNITGRITATVDYNKAGNKGSSPTSEMRIMLSEADTTITADNTDYGIIQIPVPGGGISVPEGGLCAVTISFIPGFSYSEGDTIQHDWATPPDKKLNHFLSARYIDNSKLLGDFQTYNTGLVANRSSRYTSLIWNNRYIPGHAWNNYDENYYMLFHIVAQKVSVPELGEEVNIYPNPSVQTPTIIEGNLHNTSMFVTDMQGRLVLSKLDLDDYNEIELKAGTYILYLDREGARHSVKLIKY